MKYTYVGGIGGGKQDANGSRKIRDTVQAVEKIQESNRDDSGATIVMLEEGGGSIKRCKRRAPGADTTVG